MNADADNRSVVLDACVLVPIRLTMTLLWLAEAGAFEPLWSGQILAEVERSLHTKLGLAKDKATSRVEHMRRGFDAALVDDFDDLVATMTCHPKDRHVLAAAVRAEAGTLVTTNLKDFAEESTAEYGIAVKHPDTFLAELLTEQRQTVLAVLDREVAHLRKPASTTHEWLVSLTHIVPTFANQAADALVERDEEMSPVPALVVADEDVALTAYGERGDLTNPAQVGLMWWEGLLSDLRQARALTCRERGWGDYGWARTMVAGLGLASKVIRAIDAPHRVAFMRFVPEPPTAVRVFQAFPTTAVVLVLVTGEDGTWRVWGLGPNMVAARDVIGDESPSGHPLPGTQADGE